MLFQLLRISNTTLVLINLFLRLFACYHSLHRLACDVRFDHNVGKCQPKSLIICFIPWVSSSLEPPGNSPNRHMAGEEFWRGNNNGIVAPKIRMKLVTEIWKEKYFGTKFYLHYNFDEIVLKGKIYVSLYFRTGKSGILAIGLTLFYLWWAAKVIVIFFFIVQKNPNLFDPSNSVAPS